MINNLVLRFLTTIVIAPLIIIIIYFGGIYFNVLLLILFLFGVYELILIKNKKFFLSISLIFILFLYSCYDLRSLPNGKDHLLLIVIITWLSDVGGYIFGKFIGGKKINFISPNKTYTGFLGSILFSFISIFYINFININLFNSTFYNFIFILLSSVSVILGDLFFSFVKRQIKIKDFSNLIPGHGGLFDRIDGMIILTIIYYLFNLMK